VGQTNEMARRVHSGCAGEISISALLAKVLLALSARLLTVARKLNGCGEVNHSFSLMARFALHRANIAAHWRRADRSRHVAETRSLRPVAPPRSALGS